MEYIFQMTEVCAACQKEFKDIPAHLKRMKLCKEWTELLDKNEFVKNDFKTQLASNIQTIHNYEKPENGFIKCMSCHKTFSNIGNLHKHINRTLICQKWEDYHRVQTRDEFKLNTSTAHSTIIRDHSKLSIIPISDPVDIFHIIWNVFLTDKESNITQEQMKENNIQAVIGIFPPIINYNKFKIFEIIEESENVTFDVLKYEHTGNVEFTGFDDMCNKIEEYRKERKNILVLCNNGYQRSVPFLCYYMIKYHKNEIPDLDKALDIILPQVDKTNYLDSKKQFLKQLTPYFKLIY